MIIKPDTIIYWWKQIKTLSLSVHNIQSLLPALCPPYMRCIGSGADAIKLLEKLIRCDNDHNKNPIKTFPFTGIFGGSAMFPGGPELALGLGMNALRHCRRRKARTVFSDLQLTGLEKRFEAQRYVSQFTIKPL